MNAPAEVVETEAPAAHDSLTRLALGYANAADKNAAMTAIWRRIEPQIRTIARRMLGNEADADDAVQDVAVILVQKLSTFTGNSQFSTWLHRVTVNAVLAKRQKRGRTDARYQHVPVDDVCDPNSISDVEDAEDARYRVDQALAGLSAVRRDAIRLAYIDDVPNAAAAAEMGIGVGAYKSHLHRGKAAMLEFLRPREADMGIWERADEKAADATEPAPVAAATAKPLVVEAVQPDDAVEQLVQYDLRQRELAGEASTPVELAARRAEAQRLLAQLLGSGAGTAA